MTTLADACAELATLIPCLAAALPRDNTTTGPGGDPSASVPFNPDVMYAITVIAEIPAATKRAAETVGELWRPRPIPICLRALPRLSQRMTATGERAAATQLEAATHHWVRVTKIALGFRLPDTPVPGGPWFCPAADHTGPPSELRRAGAEAFLRRGGDGPPLEWQDAGRIYCPGCGADWPVGEWPHLGHLLQSVTA
jgi:hypothetical protein